MSILPALLLFGQAALANGQTTHVWITREATTRVPAGDLHDLVNNPDLEPMLVHGTMFPDGGYPLGHPYGESAHWEPLQTRYLDWIKATYSIPYSGEALLHIAFLMGMGSHGLADQTFDAFYLNRSQLYDGELGWANGFSMDEATDFKWASLTSGQDVPERWLPGDVLVELFAEEGIEVNVDTLHSGQDLLEIAVGAVGASASVGGDLSRYEEQFPWAMTNLENTDLPGVPDYEADVVASYWAEIWDRLHSRSGAELIDRTWPEDGGYGLTTDATSPDARVSIIFKQGLYGADLTPELFTVVDSSGAVHDVDIWLYYGNDSHIVHLVPQSDWPEDDWLTVTVGEGLPTRTGATLDAPFVFMVSTLPPPVDSGQPADTATPQADESEARPKSRCGCAIEPSPASAWWWAPALVALVQIHRREQRSTAQ